MCGVVCVVSSSEEREDMMREMEQVCGVECVECVMCVVVVWFVCVCDVCGEVMMREVE